MIGSVSATVGGTPALFTLRGDRIWEVGRSPGVPDDALDVALARLMPIADAPDPIRRAARLLGGTPFIPRTE